jgi:hypothetical protein
VHGRRGSDDLRAELVTSDRPAGGLARESIQEQALAGAPPADSLVVQIEAPPAIADGGTGNAEPENGLGGALVPRSDLPAGSTASAVEPDIELDIEPDNNLPDQGFDLYDAAKTNAPHPDGRTLPLRDSLPDTDLPPDAGAPIPVAALPALTDDQRQGSASTERAPSDPVGARLADEQVLVRRLPGEQQWRSVLAGDKLRVGDLIQSLPTYRPQFTIDDSVRCTLVDASRAELGPGGELSTPNALLLVEPVADATTISLRLAGKPIQVELATPDSQLAVRVEPQRVPGSDPEADSAHTVVELLMVQGTATVHVGGSSQIITTDQKLLWVDEIAPQLVRAKKRPRWTAATSLAPIERGASGRLYSYFLDPQKDTIEVLQERSNDRRQDIKSLAVRALAAMGNFDSIVASFDDPEQHSYWSAHFFALRAALAESREDAARVRAALERAHGAESGELYTMLWGFNGAQLNEGAAENLVAFLSHPSLPQRVLAFENLKEITGGVTVLYRPNIPARQRTRRVREWADLLRAGRIVYKEPPEIVALLNDFSAPDTNPVAEEEEK